MKSFERRSRVPGWNMGEVNGDEVGFRCGSRRGEKRRERNGGVMERWLKGSEEEGERKRKSKRGQARRRWWKRKRRDAKAVES